MKRSIAAWIVSVLSACTPLHPAANPEGGPPTPEAPVAGPVQAHPRAPVEGVRPELVIGVLRPGRPNAAARRANRAGLKLHEAGDYDGARARFAEAVAADSGNDMARFNLACALARLGRHVEAAAELVGVLSRDPAEFAGRLRHDPDLESLRNTPVWAGVADHLARAEAALDHAFERGVPAMFYAHTRPWASWGTPQQGGTRNLVVGLYLHDTGRFVPLARGGEAGYVDLARKRVVRIESVVWEGAVHSMWRSSKLTVRSFAPGDDLAVAVDLDAQGPRAVGEPDFWNNTDNTGFEISMTIVPTDEGLWLDLEWHTKSAEPFSKRTEFELGPAGLSRTSRPLPPGSRIEWTYEGAAILDPTPVGHRVKGRRYHPPGRAAPIELGQGHRHARWQSVALTPDGRFAIVTSIEQRQGPGFDDTGTGLLRHVVDRVDLGTGEARTLMEGRGTARTIIGPDGALYIQGGENVRRWPSAEATDPEPLPDGLQLAPPLDPIVCELCG